MAIKSAAFAVPKGSHDTTSAHGPPTVLFPIGRRDLRGLVLVASAKDPENKWPVATFDVTATVTGVRAALGEIQADLLAAVEGAAGPPTLDALCEQLTAERYTLLHIVCHGWYKLDIGEST